MRNQEREIIEKANDAGYFPTRHQASDIISLSCTKLFRLLGPNGYRQITEELWNKCDLEAIEEVMEGKWSEEIEDKKLKEEFFNSEEGRAFAEGKISRWEPGETSLSRAIKMGYWPSEKLMEEIEFAASCRSWSKMTDAQHDAILDWAIIACVKREIQYLTPKQ